VALYVLYFTDKCHKKEVKFSEESASVELPAGTIVYIQLDSLMNRFDLFHDLRSDLQAKAKAIDDDLTRRGRAFERDYNTFVDNVNKGMLTFSQREAQGTQLENRQRELEQFARQKEMEIEEEERVVLNKVFNELNMFLETYNQEHNYALILTTSASTNSILIGDKSLDITRKVVAGLNAQYAAQNRRR